MLLGNYHADGCKYTILRHPSNSREFAWAITLGRTFGKAASRLSAFSRVFRAQPAGNVRRVLRNRSLRRSKANRVSLHARCKLLSFEVDLLPCAIQRVQIQKKGGWKDMDKAFQKGVTRGASKVAKAVVTALAVTVGVTSETGESQKRFRRVWSAAVAQLRGTRSVRLPRLPPHHQMQLVIPSIVDGTTSEVFLNPSRVSAPTPRGFKTLVDLHFVSPETVLTVTNLYSSAWPDKQCSSLVKQWLWIHLRSFGFEFVAVDVLPVSLGGLARLRGPRAGVDGPVEYQALIAFATGNAAVRARIVGYSPVEAWEERAGRA